MSLRLMEAPSFCSNWPDVRAMLIRATSGPLGQLSSPFKWNGGINRDTLHGGAVFVSPLQNLQKIRRSASPLQPSFVIAH
jgi:hypothetical protein